MTVLAATADCEQRDDWLLEQDVNAWSSLAYVVAGVVLLWQVGRGRLPRAVLGLALVVAIEGFGSLLYHGAASDVSQFLHDVALIGALGFVAGWHVGRLSGQSNLGSLIGLAVGLAVATGTWLWLPDATNATVAVAVAVTAGASLLARRGGLTGVWSLPLFVLGAVAVTMWALGQPASPLCDPESWLQPHGLWHGLTAVLALAWVDSAYAAIDPDNAPRLVRRFTDRTLGLAARGLVLAFHRSVDIRWIERLPRDRPVLIVANHANGFVDPLVVAGVLGRLPRFLAKAALWKVLAARPFLWLAGVLPVYRTGDGDRASNNASVFDACHRELQQGATVAIFPEGTTGDRAGLDRVKSGAARIALGALATAPDLVIVPIGMAFESRVETRSRAVVMFGEPIEVAQLACADDGDERAGAARLTEQITAALQAVSPQFASVGERELLRAAAREEAAASGDPMVPTFGDSEVVARQLAAAPDHLRAQVADAYRTFATRLQLVGVTARQLRVERVPISRLVFSAVVILLAGPFLVAITAVHLPAIALVVLGTGIVSSTATKGTVRMLLGLVALLLTWIGTGALLADGWAAVGIAVVVAGGGAVALFVWPPITRQLTLMFAKVRVRDRVALVAPVIEARTRLITVVRAAAPRHTESESTHDHP